MTSKMTINVNPVIELDLNHKMELEEMIGVVSLRCFPEEVFTEMELEFWAESRGYIKSDELSSIM